MLNPIVITGMGIVSALGIGQQANFEALSQGVSGVGIMHYLQSTHTEIPVGEVKLTDQQMREIMNLSLSETITRTPLLAMMALREALCEARLVVDGSVATAFINGTTVGGMEKSEQYYSDFLDDRYIEYIAVHDCGAGTEIVADHCGKFDLVTTISTACSSASNAIIMGANLIKSGRVDIAVVGGAECLSKFHLNGFNTLMILDTHPCKPFDKERHGLNLGEGAAYLVLERESIARRRGANIICTLSGYANACDAYHQTSSSPQGDGATFAMQEALYTSGLKPSDIDYVNAHGTGTENNDASESQALQRVFGTHVPLVSSTKAFTGHTTSAAGSVEAVISILALQHNFVPQSLNFDTPMNSMEWSPVSRPLFDHPLRHVMSNSFGFGGNDSSCIFSKI